jgi:hypothetical protein
MVAIAIAIAVDDVGDRRPAVGLLLSPPPIPAPTEGGGYLGW